METLPADGPTEQRKKEDFAMQHVMKDLRGRVAGRTVRAWVAEVLS